MSMLRSIRATSPTLGGGSSAIPALIAPAIEESLRFNTSAQRFKRVVMRETELYRQTLRSGDKVALAFGSGNRDERVLTNSWRAGFAMADTRRSQRFIRRHWPGVTPTLRKNTRVMWL
jgi:hypothetical protein